MYPLTLSASLAAFLFAFFFVNALALPNKFPFSSPSFFRKTIAEYGLSVELQLSPIHSLFPAVILKSDVSQLSMTQFQKLSTAEVSHSYQSDYQLNSKFREVWPGHIPNDSLQVFNLELDHSSQYFL